MICPACSVHVECPLCGREEGIEHTAVFVASVGAGSGAAPPRFLPAPEIGLYEAWRELAALAIDHRTRYQSDGPQAARRAALDAGVLVARIEQLIEAAEEERA